MTQRFFHLQHYLYGKRCIRKLPTYTVNINCHVFICLFLVTFRLHTAVHLTQTISVARSYFQIFFQKSPFCLAFCHCVIIFQRENLAASLISYFLITRFSILFVKIKTKLAKSKKYLRYLKKIARKCFGQRQKSAPYQCIAAIFFRS